MPMYSVLRMQVPNRPLNSNGTSLSSAALHMSKPKSDLKFQFSLGCGDMGGMGGMGGLGGLGG